MVNSHITITFKDNLVNIFLSTDPSIIVYSSSVGFATSNIKSSILIEFVFKEPHTSCQYVSSSNLIVNCVQERTLGFRVLECFCWLTTLLCSPCWNAYPIFCGEFDHRDFMASNVLRLFTVRWSIVCLWDL